MRASASALLPVLAADPQAPDAIEASDAAGTYRLPLRYGQPHRYRRGAVENPRRSVATPGPQPFRATNSRLRP